MDQTQTEFLVELEELVELIYLDLDNLRDATLEPRERREIIDRVFRRVHSVKGSSASFGLNAISQIAHQFEHLLEAARVGRVVLDDDVLDACDSAVDALSKSLDLFANGIEEPSTTKLFEQLRAITRGNKSDLQDDSFLKTLPSDIWRSLTAAEKHRLTSAVKEGSGVFLISTSFDVESFDEEFFRLKEKLAAWGDVISTSPAVDHTRHDKINFQVLYASAIEPANLQASLTEFPNVVINPVENEPVEPLTGLPASFPSISPSASSLANFVRTDLATLDRLISSTHELFRRTSNALDMAIAGSASKELQQTNAELKDSFLSIEDELINLRMVSLGPTLQRAIRAGRTAARLAGKEIDFEVTGNSLRIDKLLADAIADPLIHLIRNAVDHGIENGETRVQAGKRRSGTVRISAGSESGRSRVSVSDDGRGIAPEVVSAAAKRLGIIQSANDLDFEQSVRLLFRPGFTTADSVSNLSGRGVGLDVVEESIERAGGAIRVASKPGAGTSFEIRLPVTFGLIEATIVVSDGQRYCIAASQTLMDGEIDGATNLQSTAAVSLRELLGHPPLTQTVSLRAEATEAFQSSNNSPPDAPLIICLLWEEPDTTTAHLQKSVRIKVDKIEGTEKVLVRGLGRHAGRWYGVAGATELTDGSVVLVLDLDRLLRNRNN